MIREREHKGLDERIGPRFVWVFLALSVTGVLLFRGHDSAWPLIGWTMYWRVGEPPDVVRAIRVEAQTADGRRRIFFPSDPLTHVERPLVERVMWQAFDSNPSTSESRRFLILLLESRWAGAVIDTVRGWRLEWDVAKGQALRRFDRRAPDRQYSLGAFRVENYR